MFCEAQIKLEIFERRWGVLCLATIRARKKVQKWPSPT